MLFKTAVLNTCTYQPTFSNHAENTGVITAYPNREMTISETLYKDKRVHKAAALTHAWLHAENIHEAVNIVIQIDTRQPKLLTLIFAIKDGNLLAVQ